MVIGVDNASRKDVSEKLMKNDRLVVWLADFRLVSIITDSSSSHSPLGALPEGIRNPKTLYGIYKRKDKYDA